MLNKIAFIAIMLFCFGFSSCRQKERHYTKIVRETQLSDTISMFRIDRGVAFLNEKYILFCWSPLICDSTYPKWIKRRHPPILDLSNSEYNPTIEDIPVPYKLIKEKGSNYFTVIKNSDSLKFELNVVE